MNLYKVIIDAINTHQIAISHLFAAKGPPKFDTVITVQSTWKPVKNRCAAPISSIHVARKKGLKKVNWLLH